MIDRFAEALSIFWGKFWLITAIVLTIWLPGNLLTNYVNHIYDGNNYLVFKITLWFETIFGPIYIGALIHALYQIKSGRSATYRESITTGFNKWGRLFGARFVAGILISLGFIALVVPGIILALRYSFLDETVILENKDISGSRSRSTELTEGKRWEILGSVLLFFVSYFLFGLIIQLPYIYFESLDNIVMDIVIDCILDVTYTVLQIVIFLFYWESRQGNNVVTA